MKFTNYRQIDTELAKLISKTPQVSAKALPELGEKLRARIAQFAPRNTGEYASSWKVGPLIGNKITVETPQGFLYIILEFQGRLKGRIEGDPLHFVINGVNVFVSYVDHPGFPPMPHARPALRDTMQEAVQVVIRLLREEISLFGRG